MSSALASARKRSMAPPPPSPLRPGFVPPQQGSAPQQQGGVAPTAPLTLPQIIDIYGRRLLQIEKHIASSSASASDSAVPKIDEKELSKQVESLVEGHLTTFVEKEWVPLVEEWNTRHEMLAEEITSLKELLLNLQNFTLVTHKKLLDIALEPFSTSEEEDITVHHNDENILAGGNNILAGGNNILAGGNNILAGGNNILAGGNNILDEEPEESHESIQSYLEEALKSIPEEYELNP